MPASEESGTTATGTFSFSSSSDSHSLLYLLGSFNYSDIMHSFVCYLFSWSVAVLFKNQLFVAHVGVRETLKL